MSGPSSSLRRPLSKAGISQDHECLTQRGHWPRCQHLDQARGLCKHPIPERSPSPKSWPASGVQVHLLDSVGCLAARAQRVLGAETVGFPGHLTFLHCDCGPLRNLRCSPAGTDSPDRARGQDRLGLHTGTGSPNDGTVAVFRSHCPVEGTGAELSPSLPSRWEMDG